LSGACGLSGLAIPGEQVADPSCRMVADTGEEVGDRELRVEAVERGALDQRIESGGAMPAGIGAGEEVIPVSDRGARRPGRRRAPGGRRRSSG
jgi:hypothetical protein